MNVAKGNILIITEGLEVSGIKEDERDEAVRGFYEMKTEAERCQDKFFVLQSLYLHRFSYGEFYPSFMNLSWPEFSSIDSLHGIKESTYELMHTFCQCPSASLLVDEDVFRQKNEPRAYSGYCNSRRLADCICNKQDWERWHRKWFSAQQQLIDWNGATNDWLPRQDLICEILRRELELSIGKDSTKAIEDNDVGTVFYDQVMRHKGDEIHAYAGRIGSEVCLSNYYIEETELSTMEQQSAGGSFRKIYSIINRKGVKQFVSIDFKHGMFELHDELGIHLGEYRFDGTMNAEGDLSHSLKCLTQWRRQQRQ